MPATPGGSAFDFGLWTQNFGLFSWQPPKYSLSQDDFEQQQPQSRRYQPPEEFLMMRELFDLRFRFFLLVNLCVDGLELLRVVSAVILSAGHLRDLLQSVLVNVHRYPLIDGFASERIAACGHRGLAPHPHTYGIGLHIQRLGCFRRRQGWDFARIVLSVSHQDNNLAF